MTSERDIERILDHWFTERPTQVADRVLDQVADGIARQRQYPAWRAFRKDAHVSNYVKPLLAIAAVVVLAVAGLSIFRPFWSVGPSVGAPSPLPPPLPEGRLAARDYTARAAPGDAMAFVISAPEGWSGFGGFFIGGPNDDPTSAPDGIGISFNHDPQVVADPCNPPREDPGVTPSINDLVAALTARPDLLVADVTDVTLAGYSGKRLDIQFPTELACDNQYVFAEPKGLYANGPANHWRVWLLDADGETAVVVLLSYAATPGEDLAIAQAVIDTVRIIP